MRVFCYFVEPASYTVDLIKNIHSKQSIDYAFIHDKSFATSKKEKLIKETYLSRFSLFKKIRYIFNIWRDYNFIIINGYNNYPFLFTFLFNIFSSKKKYLAIESDTQLIVPRFFLKRWIKSIYLRYIFQSKVVLGFSGGTQKHKELFRYYGMDEDRIFLMPMMVDNKKFYRLEKTKKEDFIFLYVGRLVSRKNVEFLIKSFNSVFFNKNAILRIVGDGNQKDYLSKKYSSNIVKFIGKKVSKELVQEYHNSSVLICPSVFEPWGLVVNEALSSGVPVIASREVGAVYDLIHKKETGFVIENQDQLEKSMLELFKNPRKLLMYSRNAEGLMRNYWNYRLYKKSLQKAINRICEG